MFKLPLTHSQRNKPNKKEVTLRLIRNPNFHYLQYDVYTVLQQEQSGNGADAYALLSPDGKLTPPVLLVVKVAPAGSDLGKGIRPS